MRNGKFERAEEQALLLSYDAPGWPEPAAIPIGASSKKLTDGCRERATRESGDTAARMFERAEESALLLRMMREAAVILGARWNKVSVRQRPHYSPETRFRNLRIRSFLALSQREAADMFRVSVETIARETETASVNGEDGRPLIAPHPPVRRCGAQRPGSRSLIPDP